MEVFTDYNRTFLADQLREPDYPMAARGADRFLDELGIAWRSLPYYFRIDRQTHAELLRATRVLVDAQEKLVRHVCASRTPEELQAMFGVPTAMAAQLDWAGVGSRGLRMLRADIIPTDTGYHFCELNHFPGVGAAEATHSALAFAELLGRSVAGVSAIRQQARLYATECRRGGFSRLVILDSTKHYAAGFGEKWLLQRYLRLMAPELDVSYRDELSYPADWFAPEEAGRTMVHRLVTFSDTADEGAFLAAVRDSGATFSGLYESELKMHRRWFSLLCDAEYQELLDDDELAVIERYVPHTFTLDPGNLAGALAEKDRLVFKRSYSYGGKGVLIGDQHSAEELRDLLGADPSAWDCQRRVHTASLDLPGPDGALAPFYFVLGVFLYGDGASGLLVRGAAHSKTVNVSQGGGVSWAFVA